MSKVKSIEGQSPSKQDRTSLYYQDRVAGYECILQYLFTSKGLVGAAYAFSIDHTNTNSFIDDYNKVRDLLKVKYGDPVDDKQIWKNDLYKDNEQDWGMALSVGHLEYQALFENERTRIVLNLFGDNFKVHLQAFYYSKENWETYKNESDKVQSEGL